MTTQAAFELGLVPIAETPSAEVFQVSHSKSFSDIFPIEIIEGSGPLGDHLNETVPEDSPLFPLFSAINVERQRLYDEGQRNSELGTEATQRAIMANSLQAHLVRCINGGYHNLLAEGLTPASAINSLGGYVVEREDETAEAYDRQLEDLTARLAEIDRTPHHSDLNQPERISLSEQRAIVKLRLQRLRFEWLSATAVLVLLKREVDNTEPEARLPA